MSDLMPPPFSKSRHVGSIVLRYLYALMCGSLVIRNGYAVIWGYVHLVGKCHVLWSASSNTWSSPKRMMLVRQVYAQTSNFIYKHAVMLGAKGGLVMVVMVVGVVGGHRMVLKGMYALV